MTNNTNDANMTMRPESRVIRVIRMVRKSFASR